MVGIGGRMRSLHAYWHKNSDLDESGVPGDWVEICCVRLFYWKVIYQKSVSLLGCNNLYPKVSKAVKLSHCSLARGMCYLLVPRLIVDSDGWLNSQLDSNPNPINLRQCSRWANIYSTQLGGT